MRCSIDILCVLVALCVSAGPLAGVCLGQEEPSEDDVIVEDTPDDPRAPSAWRSALDLSDLKLRGGELGEALMAVPGVYVRRSGGPGSTETLTLRGASSQQVRVFLGGLSLGAPRGGGVDLSLLPVGLLGGAEVFRGGSGARFGSGAIGGAVVLSPELPAEGWKLVGSAGLGSTKTGKAGLGVSGGGETFRGLVSLDGLMSKGDFRFEDAQGGPRTRVNADVGRLGGMAAVHFHPSKASRWTLTGLGVVAERGQPGPSEFQDRLSKARSKESRGTLALEGRKRDLMSFEGIAVDGTMSLGLRGGRDRYRNPDRLLLSAAPYDTVASETGIEGSAQASVYSEASTIAHVRIEGGSERLVLDELVATPQREAERETARFQRGRAAVSAHLEELWFDGQLSALSAVRLESVEGLDVEVLPSFGVRWEPVESVLLMGNVARAWRAPTFDELFLKAEFIEGDPDLRSEDAVSVDGGVRWRPARWVEMEAVAFHLAIKELILFLPVSSFLFRAQNTGEARSTGVELSGKVAPWPWLVLDASYTLTDSELASAAGAPLAGRPIHKLVSGVRLRRPGVEIFARATARSSVFLDNLGNLRDEPAVFVDAGVTGSPTDTVSVGVTARNLLDERGALDALQTPLPGLSIFGQVTVSLEGGGDGR